MGVAGQGKVSEMEAFVSDFEVGGFQHVADQSGRLWRGFGVNAQPVYVFVNDDGTTFQEVGALEVEDFESHIERLLAT